MPARLIIIGFFAINFSDRSALALPSPRYRPCTADELRTPWAPAPPRPGTIFIYRSEPALDLRLALRVDGISGNTLLSSQASFLGAAPTASSFREDGFGYQQIFGFMPLQVGDPGRDLYRREQYDRAVDRVWLGPPGKIVSGRFQEFSKLFRSSRTISALFKTMVTGCADIMFDGHVEAAKVFRLVLPQRSYNPRATPPSDVNMVVDVRYFISLRSGVMMRQDSATGAIQLERVVALRKR